MTKALKIKPIKKKMILHIDLIYWLTEEWDTQDVIDVGIGTKKGIEWEIFGYRGWLGYRGWFGYRGWW